MPPFTTLNGQTGYFDNNGQFIPATQEEYNQQFGMLQQFGGNPFLNAAQQSPLNNQRTNFVQQGTIETPVTAAQTNEQKVMQAQGDNTPILGVGNMPYVKMGDQYGVQKGKSFYPFDAMTASGHPLNTVTNTVFNTGDLTSFRKGKIANPYAAEMALMQSQNTANFLNNLSNKTSQTAPVQTQVTNPIQAATTTITEPEITPTTTADQSGGGNWMSNMFNQPSVKGVPDITKTVDPKKSFNGKEFFSSEKGQDISALTGAGVGLATTLVKASAQDKYDQRVGMSKPNLTGNLFGDATFTQVGLNPALMAATGGISALVGGGVDLIKNAVKYAKQKDRYENKKLGVDTMQSIDDARENMKPDYTGYARFGTQVKNPYLNKYNNGGKVIVNGKEMSIDSDEYRRLYNTGNLMNVDEQGMPARLSTEELVITAPMTDQERRNREIQKERDAQGLNYNWSTGSQNPYTSKIQNTVLNGINYTIPSVPEWQPIFNPEDDYLKNYVGKSLGKNPFIFSAKSEVGMGYNNFGNNTWMSSGLGTVEDGPTIMGHLDTRYRNNDTYKTSLENNDIPSLYFFYKDLSKEKNWEEDVFVSANKYYNSKNELMDIGDTYEREGRFIDDFVIPQGYGYNFIMEDNGSKLIRSFTADKDKFMGSVTLTPEMYKALLEAPNQTEAKRRLMKMAKIPQDVDIDKLFIHMNLSRPRNLSAYLRAKTVNPNSVKNWHDIPPGNIYENRVFQNKKQPTTYYKETRIKNYRLGGILQNPYLPQARSGIYIKPENRGKFTKWAQSHDMGVQEAASTVMANKEEHSPSIVKMANFAKNSKKWN